MPPEPAHADPPSEPGDPVPAADWITAAEWEAWCDADAAADGGEPPPGFDGENEEEEPEEPGGPVLGAAGFASGGALDALPGGSELAYFAAAVAGDDDRYAGVPDGVLDGVIAAWDRVEAYAGARKHAAVAEFIRRRPEPGTETAGPGQMPGVWDEFAGDELRVILAESRAAAEHLMGRAAELAGRLPGTMALFGGGWLRESKVRVIAEVTAGLDRRESRAVEGRVLGRAGRLTPGGLRAAVARAVMEVAPGKARARREAAARDARVQRWAEDSGNAALMGRELPPAEVLAADQRITGWARELRAAGVPGSMDELRARAYLDLLLGQDSRPPADAGGTDGGVGGGGAGGAGEQGGDGRPGGSGPGGSGPGEAGPAGGDPGDGGPGAPGGGAGGGTCGSEGGPGGPGDAVVPAGFAGRVTLTVPLASLTGRADRPGDLAGLGPVDPRLARDLATAAARHPGTTWCVTVVDGQGHAAGHGCARPEPKGRAGPRRRRRRGKPGPPGGTGAGPYERDGRAGVLLHPPGAGRAAGRVRDLAAAHPRRRPGPDPRAALLCNAGPKCRHDHRLKQRPGWRVDQLPDGRFRWTTPSGRSYDTEPTRYPI